MKFNHVGGVEYFDDSTLYWVSILDLPPEIQSKAQEIDGEAYSPDSFEICAIFDLNTRQFSYETDGGELNIYYVDNDGNRCWFQAELSEDFLNEVYSACEKITDGKLTLDGYAVTDQVNFDNGHGYVFAEKADAKRPFAVLHIAVDEYGRWNYSGERTFDSAEAARSDYSARVKRYSQFRGIVKPSLAARLQKAKQEAVRLDAQRQDSPSHKPHDRDAR